MAATGSTSSSMTSTSHTLTAFPSTQTKSFQRTTTETKSSSMADLESLLAPQNRHAFITPPPSIPDASLQLAKNTLDAFAATLGEEQAERLKEQRKKRKRHGGVKEDGEVLKIRKIHIEGFEVEQVWEQARRVIDALRLEAERGLETVHHLEEVSENEGKNRDGGVKLMKFDEDEFEIGSDDESSDQHENSESPSGEGEEGILDEDVDIEDDFDGMDSEEDFLDEDRGVEGQGPAGVYVEDPHGLNDGFFSIDDFNKQTEFLERQDAAADPYTGEASNEEDIDWDADPMAVPPTKATSSSRRAAAMDVREDEEDNDEDSDDEDGPTFGNMDLNAPEGDSEEDEDDDMDVEMDPAGDNTNDILYKDFFEPPPRKAAKGERQKNYLARQARITQLEEVDAGAEVERAMADVRRDLFDESEQDNSDEALSEVDPSDPKSRRSAHERRQAKLAEEIRRLEAASVAKREWTLSGEARAVDRPKDSLLDEDLEFERTGKPVPVITAEITESIEELIKRRILAQEFDEVIRRRPDSLNNPTNARRGAFELDDTKPQQSLAEMYEEEHVMDTNPNTYISKSDEKLRKEEKEIEALWKTTSASLDALCSWHYRPRPAAPSLTVISGVATIAMEDAQPTTASGINGGDSMLAPQEIYKAGEGENSIEKREVVPKGGAPVAREEMTREQKLRRRRREKERIRKSGGDVAKRPESNRVKGKQETVADLKKGGVRVIDRKGEIRDVDGNKIKASTAFNGAGRFKL